MMSLVNKVTKTFRWLRWSTVCAILFYMFFIGLILHSTTRKLQSTLQSQHEHEHEHDHDHDHDHGHQPQSSLPFQTVQHPDQHQQMQQQQLPPPLQQAQSSSSIAAGSNVLDAPQRNALTSATQQNKHNTNNNNNNKNKANTNTNALQPGGAKARKFSEPETVIFAASSVNEKQILEKAFSRADKNRDKQLTIPELAVYVNRKIVDHIEEAIQLNPREFRRVDISPADGLATWEEYHRFFLKEHDMTEADLDKNKEIKNIPVFAKAREEMDRDRARWSEAARTDLFSLTIDEYLSFRHPESSISNLLELVDDLLRQFDQDGDDQLTIEEFSNVSMDDDDDLIRKSLISRTVVERQEEFKRIIDQNNDGRADRGELLRYVNPKTPRYALQEAATLFSLADENKDGKLTLDEMVSNAEIFLTSKMIDTANSFHTEF